MRRALLIVLALALALRLAPIALNADLRPFGDPADYDRIARAIAATGGYPSTTYADPGGPSALRPPAYPYLLAGVYEVAGIRFNFVRVIGALLGTAAVLLLYLLVARVWRDRRLALWSAGIAAVAPPLIWLNGSLLAENLFIPLALAALLCVASFRAHDRDRGSGLWLAAGAGALLGLAVLTRTNGIVLALPIVLGLARPRAAVAALAALCVVLAPWTIRNAIEFERFLPLGTQSGYTMAGQWNGLASQPGDFRAAWRVPQSVGEFADVFGQPDLDEGDVDAELRSRALEFAVEHPGAPATAFVLNTVRLLGVGPGSGFVSGVAHEEMSVPAGQQDALRIGGVLLAVLAIAGAALLRPRGPLWLWLAPVLLWASVVLWLGSPRYLAPAVPFLAILAAAALLRLRRVHAS